MEDTLRLAAVKMNATHVGSGSEGSQREANLKAEDDTYVEEKHDENTDATAGTFAYGIEPAHQKKVMYVPTSHKDCHALPERLLTLSQSED